MALETATYINNLVTTNPTSTDPKSQGDDHLRLIKTTLKNSFAGFPGMVIVTGSEAQGATVNDYTVTISPAPAAYTTPLIVMFMANHANTGAATVQINALGTKLLLDVNGNAITSGTIKFGSTCAAMYDGTNFYLISPNGLQTSVTPATGDNSTKIATTAFVVAAVMAATLPGQTGNKKKLIITDGVTASWGDTNISQAELLLAVDSSITTASNLGAINYFQAVAIDATHDLLIFAGASSMHAVVYDTDAKTFGSPSLIRSVGSCQFAALVIAANTVLLCSCPNSGTAMETVVLTTSGTTLTVNSPLATTLAGASQIVTGSNRLVQVGSSYLIEYGNASGIASLRAITVSGTTPSIGAELVLTGFNSSEVMQTYAVSASVALAIHASNTTLYATPIAVSGTTIAVGTQATTALSARAGVCSAALSSGRYGVIYQNSTVYGGIITVSGTTATLSVVNLTLGATAASMSLFVVGSQALVTGGSNVTVLTDNAGTAVAGAVDNSLSSPTFFGYNAAATAVLANASGNGSSAVIGISGNNPNVITAHKNAAVDAYATAQNFGKFTQERSRIANGTLRTANGKHSVVSGNAYAFSPVTDGSGYSSRANTFVLSNPANVRQHEAWGCDIGAGNTLYTRKVVIQ